MAATDARARALPGLVALAVLASSPTTGHADEASGTVTGRVETRGSYYWERSTRVVAPTIGGRIDMPNGVSVQGHYLVDSITSASVAAGALVDVGFTEIRHEGSVGALGEHEVGTTRIGWNASYRGSREPDYRARGASVGGRIAWDERNQALSLQVSGFRDTVLQLFRVGSQIRPPAMGSFEERFSGVALSLSYERTLNERLVLVVGQDLARLSGYLASPYRQVPVDGVLQPEAHPDERLRLATYARLVVALPEAHSALHLGVRHYVDSFGIDAISTDARYYQQLGEALLLRLHYRYYRQSAADFESGLPVPTYTGAPVHFTADPKMQAFLAHEFGLAAVTSLSFLEGTFLERGEVEFAFDYRRNTNRFGDGVIGSVAVRLPF